MPTASSFWNYACHVYANPSVKAICLRLQDVYHLNVNVVLYCLYVGRQGRVITPSSFAQLSTTLQPWNERITQPLREIRRQIKSQYAETPVVYKKILETELACEQEEQRIIEAVLGKGESNPESTAQYSTTVQNLKYYCSSCGVTVMRDDPGLIQQLSDSVSSV